MKGELGDRQRLLHILDAIGEIDSYLNKIKYDEFLQNSMMRFACVKQLEIVGEAANLISAETKNKFESIKWRPIIGLRNILIHEYFGIDNELVWQILKEDIPQLRTGIEKILKIL